MTVGARLVLASASARRREPLAHLDVAFDCRPADLDESPLVGEAPHALVERLAGAKAAAVASGDPDEVVVGADTEVALDGVALGKPTDHDDAARMLTALSGRTHEVCTGVAVLAGGTTRSLVATTTVSFVALSPRDVAWYVATAEPMGKAGAYGVQGRGGRFVTRLEGSLDAVIGLPRAALVDLWADMGYDLAAFAG